MKQIKGFLAKNKILCSAVPALVVVIVLVGVFVSAKTGKKDSQSEQAMNEMEEIVEITQEESLENEASTEEILVAKAEEQVDVEETETKQADVDLEKTEEKVTSSKKSVKEKEEKSMVDISEENVPETDKLQQEDVIKKKEDKVNPDKNNSLGNEEWENESGNGNSSDEKPSNDQPSVSKPGNDKPKLDPAYKLVWEDDFNGTELSRNDWNVELHEPGWVNQEWQEYIDSDENIYVKDGNLVIQAVKTTKDGKDYYTSGRVNTQNKHDFKYGRFEARAKVPSGKGFLPAFWMMPTDEGFYGQWPKCGEIDIMEVLGDNTKTAHGTLHFGEPHTQRQGTYRLKNGDFSSEYHVFACEWEPGEIRFYVDDVLYFTENDWFTKRNGFGEVAYPAPYDQPFYMILNVAVGGSWVGYPDETTKFEENARLVVDYVRVYQKDEYDENVKKPITEVVLRDPDKAGNYLNNGDFSKNESLSDGKDWEFLTALGGVGTAEVADAELQIKTEKEGTADYSIQMVQGSVPFEKGWKYKLSFDAYADEARTLITSVTAPDLNYSRYFADTKINLTTQPKSYSFEFDMTADSDANGRVEFNLGNQKSTATVHIDNVRVEKVEKITLKDEAKSVLPDGNYVYNGSFNEGAGRMDYWETKNQCEGAKLSVSNVNLLREFKAEVPSTVTALEDVILKQSPIALSGGKTYKFTFDAYGNETKNIKVRLAGKTFNVAISKEKKTYSFVFDTDSSLKGTDLEFLLGVSGTTYIDNVRIQEDGMIVNGDFVNGMVGYEAYINESAKASYGVDELTENAAMGFTIEDTGDQDWMIQLKQNNIKLEEGKWYKITFDAKSNLDRTIMYALQRDGSGDDNWIPYSGTQKIDVSSDYQTYEHVFKMKNDTDEQTILSISMGAVNGKRITDKHTVFIDNITLEETEEPKQSEKPVGDELIQNGDFTKGQEKWENAITAPGEADVSFEDGRAVYQIKNVGTADWNVQLKQSGLTLEKGSTYELSFKVKSDKARTIKAALLTETYDWYGGADIDLKQNEEKEVNVTISVDKETDTNITFVLSMGIIDGKDTPASTIEIDDISIKKQTKQDNKDEEGNKDGLLVNGDFSKGADNWINAITAPGEATASFEDGKAVYRITNVGEQEWHIQLKQSGLTLENGKNYELCLKLKSDEARTVKAALLTETYDWYGGADIELAKDEEKKVVIPLYIDKETDTNITFVLSMGIMDGKDTPASTIEIDDISLNQVSTYQARKINNKKELEMIPDEATAYEEELTSEEETTSEELTLEEEESLEENTSEDVTSEDKKATDQKEDTSALEEAKNETSSEDETNVYEEESKKEKNETKQLDAKTEEGSEEESGNE